VSLRELAKQVGAPEMLKASLGLRLSEIGKRQLL
jgi:hypothetical protein